MNTIYEGICKDGTRQLVSPATIDRIADACKLYAPTRRASGFANILAKWCYCQHFEALIEIRYDSNGNTKRTLVVRAC